MAKGQGAKSKMASIKKGNMEGKRKRRRCETQKRANQALASKRGRKVSHKNNLSQLLVY